MTRALGTAGLGKETVTALAKHNPSQIFFSGRSSSKASTVIDRIKANIPNAKISFIECDFTSLEAVAKGADDFISKSPRLDILICNAGVMALPPELTKDGYEIQFGTNHMAHALLIKKLLPILLKTAAEPKSDVRVVFLTSAGFRNHPPGGIAFKDLKTTQDTGAFGSWMRYGQSKLANVLYPAELARRYPNITTASVHPGMGNTALVTDLPLSKRLMVYLGNFGKPKMPSEIIDTQIWAATGDKSAIQSGAYYEPIGVLGKHTKDSNSEKLAGELWDWTQKELEAY